MVRNFVPFYSLRDRRITYCVPTPVHVTFTQYSGRRINNFTPVGRLMKMALSKNAIISASAKVGMQKCASEFISFITSAASGHRQKNQATIQRENILSALKSLGFQHYAIIMECW
ncbi:hypothetical protein EJ04DRAFT_449120, partial [Polyplosphaeria fusca]